MESNHMFDHWTYKDITLCRPFTSFFISSCDCHLLHMLKMETLNILFQVVLGFFSPRFVILKKINMAVYNLMDPNDTGERLLCSSSSTSSIIGAFNYV